MSQSRKIAVYLPWGLGLLCAFGLSFWVRLIYDDAVFVLRDRIITGPWPGWSGFFLSSFTWVHEYEPIPRLLHWILYRVAGESPWIYRSTSLLLHGVNIWLCRRLWGRLTSDASAALWACVLFSLHPAHVEVLAVSTFKKHLLVSACVLASLNLQLASGIPRFPRWAACWSFFGAGLLCKESALILPALALLVSWVSAAGKPASRWEAAGFYGGFAVVAAGYLVFRALVFPRSLVLLGWDALSGVPFTAGKCLFWALSEVIVPWNLCLEHSLRPVASALAMEAVGWSAGIAALGLFGRLLMRRDRAAFFGLAWACVCLSPFLNVFPFLNFSLVSDRYLYLASAGLLLSACRLLRHALLSEHRFRAACLAAAACYGGLSIRHMARFTDPVELWSRTARCAPLNPRSHANLAQACLGAGNVESGIGHYRKAVSLTPDPYPSIELAMTYRRLRMPLEAIAVLRAQMAKRPDRVCAFMLALSYDEAGDAARSRAASAAFRSLEGLE